MEKQLTYKEWKEIKNKYKQKRIALNSIEENKELFKTLVKEGFLEYEQHKTNYRPPDELKFIFD